MLMALKHVLYQWPTAKVQPEHWSYWSRDWADEIRFAAGEGIDTHTHPESDHILFATQGEGILEYNGVDHQLVRGKAYGVPGKVVHAIWAGEEDLVLLSIGNNRVPPDAVRRIFKSSL